MNYQEALELIGKAERFGIVPGLERIACLLALLGDPQKQCRVIHIAGTNGKGSILAYLDGIFREAGYSVGRYISPSIFHYRERFQMNGTDISEEEFASCMERVQEACDRMRADGKEHPTVYELETAVSFLYFAEKKADLVLLETGMGGRLDATNVIADPLCEVIASVSMDHMQYLGDTLEKIAWEKAGIIKPGSVVVAAPNDRRVRTVLEQVCRERRAELYETRDDAERISADLTGQIFRYQGECYRLRMLGDHQIQNAVTAIETVRRIPDYPVTPEQIKAGMEKTIWKGRFEVLGTDPVFIRDGAHNEDAALRLRDALKRYLAGDRLIYIMGVFADKEYEKMAAVTAPLASEIYTITPDHPRALPAERLAETARKYCGNVTAAETLENAVRLARRAAARYGTDRSAIVVFGSLSFLGRLEALMDESGMEKERLS